MLYKSKLALAASLLRQRQGAAWGKHGLAVNSGESRGVATRTWSAVLPAASSPEGILSRAFLWLHLLYHTDPLLAGLGACRFGEQLFYDFHLPLLEEGVWSDEHCCRRAKTSTHPLCFPSFHHLSRPWWLT